MKKPFDPFDPAHQDPIRRRKHSEVVAEKEAWEKSLEQAFRNVLEDFGWPDYVTTDVLMEDAMLQHPSEDSLRRNLKPMMEKIGYVRYNNPKTKDGRWYLFGRLTTVYMVKGSARVSREFLIDYL